MMRGAGGCGVPVGLWAVDKHAMLCSVHSLVSSLESAQCTLSACHRTGCALRCVTQFQVVPKQRVAVVASVATCMHQFDVTPAWFRSTPLASNALEQYHHWHHRLAMKQLMRRTKARVAAVMQSAPPGTLEQASSAQLRKPCSPQAITWVHRLHGRSTPGRVGQDVRCDSCSA